MNDSSATPSGPEQNLALAQLDRLQEILSGSLGQLRDQAHAKRLAGDELGANLIVLRVDDLTLADLKIEAARRKVMLAKTSLAPAIEALRGLVGQANAARQQLANIAQALAAAAALIDILGRIAGILSPRP